METSRHSTAEKHGAKAKGAPKERKTTDVSAENKTVLRRLGREAKNIRIVPIADIDRHGDNVRGASSPDSLADLVESIKINGVLQPIVVEPKPNGLGYRIVAGYRRIEAARLAGLDEIPVMVPTPESGPAQETPTGPKPAGEVIAFPGRPAA